MIEFVHLKTNAKGNNRCVDIIPLLQRLYWGQFAPFWDYFLITSGGTSKGPYREGPATLNRTAYIRDSKPNPIIIKTAVRKN
jgi:hypothetical protein